MSTVKNNKTPSSTISTDFSSPIINDIETSDVKNQTGSNDNGITMLRGEKINRNDHSKVLDDLLNHIIEIRKSNISEQYSGWQGRIVRDIEEAYGKDSSELKQVKDALKLNFLTTSGQSENQRRIYFDNLYERRFNRIEQLINEFKLDQENH